MLGGSSSLTGIPLGGASDGDNQDVVVAPLQKVDVHIHVVDLAVRATFIQAFANPSSEPLEVTYTFPVLPSATVCGLTADIAGRVVKGHVAEKQAAHAKYAAAKEESKAWRYPATLADKFGPDKAAAPGWW